MLAPSASAVRTAVGSFCSTVALRRGECARHTREAEGDDQEARAAHANSRFPFSVFCFVVKHVEPQHDPAVGQHGADAL